MQMKTQVEVVKEKTVYSEKKMFKSLKLFLSPEQLFLYLQQVIRGF